MDCLKKLLSLFVTSRLCIHWCKFY